ncbi:MAG TPA: TIGR03620 family F420-dependent LLM class oxidoreductase [Actinomycetes bacterium]|jgi:probable F420-dependent oxidoreductase|nr:TIGR03620 family F420-dependent LLM class oxidoreductase [Actinomycetes bacterium]
MNREGQAATAGRALAERLGRVGLWTRQLDLRPTGQVREAVAELEELGWGSLWFWEVFGREALTSAALLLAATRRMVVASGIANVWARDPVAMAAAQRTLTEAYPGRFVLGVGVSHGPIVDARGHRYQRPLAKMRAYLEAMDTAPWQGPPLQDQPPRVLAALGPRMLQLAAERAAGALLYNTPPEATATARSVLGPGPLLAVEQAVLLETDPAAARRICREFIAFYLGLPNYTRAWERAGLGPEERAEGGSDRLVDAMVAWGGPEQVMERVRAHLDAGADHVCLQVLDPDPNGLPTASWRALAPMALLGR